MHMYPEHLWIFTKLWYFYIIKQLVKFWAVWLHFMNHSHFTVLFRDYSGEPVPEENFWTLWCKGRLTEADTLTIRLGATPIRTNQCPPQPSPKFLYLQAGCPSCHPTNSVKALEAKALDEISQLFLMDGHLSHQSLIYSFHICS